MIISRNYTLVCSLTVKEVTVKEHYLSMRMRVQVDRDKSFLYYRITFKCIR